MMRSNYPVDYVQADEHNQWDSLSEDEKVDWAFSLALKYHPELVAWYASEGQGTGSNPAGRATYLHACDSAQERRWILIH